MVVILLNSYCIGVVYYNKELQTLDYFLVTLQSITDLLFTGILGSINYFMDIWASLIYLCSFTTFVLKPKHFIPYLYSHFRNFHVFRNRLRNKTPRKKNPLHFIQEINPRGNKPPTLLLMTCAFSAFGHASDMNYGLDMKLSQPNKLSRPKFKFKMEELRTTKITLKKVKVHLPQRS